MIPWGITVAEDINGIAYLVRNGIESPENFNNAILSVQNAILSGLGKTASGDRIFNNAILSGLGWCIESSLWKLQRMIPVESLRKCM